MDDLGNGLRALCTICDPWTHTHALLYVPYVPYLVYVPRRRALNTISDDGSILQESTCPMYHIWSTCPMYHIKNIHIFQAIPPVRTLQRKATDSRT